jgi:GTP-binding protein
MQVSEGHSPDVESHHDLSFERPVEPGLEASAVAIPTPKPRNIVVEASFFAGATHTSQLPGPVVPEIAFAGRSNVGKSSLLNAMMQRKSLARTSSTPGCTRQINVFELGMDDGVRLNFVDLPGYGYAKVSKKQKADWGPMMEGYLKSRPTLRALAVLVDLRRGIEEDDQQLIDFMREVAGFGRNKPVDVVVVATKVDKLPLSKRKPVLQALRKATGEKIVGFSAVDAIGRDELWGRIRNSL